MNNIKAIKCHRFSSSYGESNNAFGQPLGVKTIVIISVETTNGETRSHELYAGIYMPEIFSNIVSKISEFYLNKPISFDIAIEANKFPFIANSGILKAVMGAIDSCIIQLYFASEGISLVQGLKTLLEPSIRRDNKNKILYYGSGGSVAFSLNECLNDLKKTHKMNLDGFKMRCGLQELDEDICRVNGVSKYIKNNLKDKRPRLMIDFIQGTLKPKLKVQELINYLKNIDSKNIYWIEEPLNPDDVNLYEELLKTEYKNIKFCLGESFTCLNEYSAFKNIVKLFQIDVTHCGGFSEAIKILNYIHKSSALMRFSSHVWGSGLSGLLNLAICRACESITWFEIPLLNFDVNFHLFNEHEIKYNEISDSRIDYYLANINLQDDKKYQYIENSGYKI